MDNKLTRVDAQSPTVQGSQSQSQSQQASSAAAGSVQHQPYMSLPHGYPGYYYPSTMVNPYSMMPVSVKMWIRSMYDHCQSLPTFAPYSYRFLSIAPSIYYCVNGLDGGSLQSWVLVLQYLHAVSAPGLIFECVELALPWKWDELTWTQNAESLHSWCWCFSVD